MAMNYLGPGMHAMDRDYYARQFTSLDQFGPVTHPVNTHEKPLSLGLGPRELGTTINPMQNQIQALQAKIREGASRLEIGFGGVGKGNSQMATPEAYGKVDREVLRQLAEYNDVKTSTHASFQLAGLAGFGQQGFSKQQQAVILEEVKKAIDFASEATTGGAVVVHTGEWQRPISEAPWAKKDFATKDGKPAYLGYPDEDKKAVIPVVDKRTGEIVSGIRKDQELFEPEWLTVNNFEKLTGRKLSGKYADGRPVETSKLNSFTFVDANGNVIDPSRPEQADMRTPNYDPRTGAFTTQKITWDTIVNRAQEYNRTHKDKKTPEEIFAITQIENRILDSRANKYFYGDVESLSQQAILIEQDMRALGEKAQTDQQAAAQMNRLAMQREEVAERIRRATQAQSSADVQERQFRELAGNLETMESYGLKQSGAALAELAEHAMAKSEKMIADAKARGSDPGRFEKIFIAPENVFTEQYGSHPDELMNIVKAGRDAFIERLKQKGLDETAAKQAAQEHIKTTLDIGHLNMWKKHLVRNAGESDEAFHKRFETWTLKKVGELHDKKMLGHIHLTDNLGYNDEHLTPGQGNAPIQSVMKFLAEKGYKDFIAEIGSFNANTILGDTWTYLGAEHFQRASQFGGQQFRDMQSRHFGGYAPPTFIFGAYSPSNEFTLWSQVPLE
jgi:sugar phosphate isomerase/epimerase